MRILVSAGEPSGDRHAASFIRALRARDPSIEVEGVGGDAMREAGAHILEDLTRLCAMGLFEAAGSVGHHVTLLGRLRRRIRAGRYDLVVPIDYPGFHLRLARIAGDRVPVLYYIAPQLWAWGGWRAGALRRWVRRLAVVLPFEESFFRRREIAAEFVGHPVVEASGGPQRADARRALGISADAPVLGLFPGSRPGDIARHFDHFRRAARDVRRVMPEVEVLVAARTPEPDGVRAVPDARLVRAAADAGIVKSGTATLEAALGGMPMVVAYRMHPLTHAVASRLVRLPHVSLVNLVAQRRLVPELIQRAATPAALAAAVVPLLDPAGGAARAQRAGFEEVRAALGSRGAADRVAAMALELAACSP